MSAFKVDERVTADVVIVGSGIAGLSVALALGASRRVHLITKLRLGQGGATQLAQGGIAAALGGDDRPALHVEDTLAVAGGLAVRHAVELLAKGAPAAIERLVRFGARFDRDGAGLDLHREAAHSRRRIVHAKDATGAEVLRALTDAVRARGEVVVFEATAATDIVTVGGRVAGVLVRDAHGQLRLHASPAVVLATGGLGQLYLHTTNPPEATGDGLALAARAGAHLADLEFVQFHPTALDVASDPLPLLTEALRGQGAVLIDETGRRFMAELHTDAELAPRDVVARGIFLHQSLGHRTFLDARALGDALPTDFPTVWAASRAHGFDPRTAPLPVTPAAHYHMGGVLVDADGRASVPGLFACGEVASTGVHGANRLASNSLLEGLVFGSRVAAAIEGTAERGVPASVQPSAAQLLAARSALPEPLAQAVIAAVRERAWLSVGLVRDEAGLRAALSHFERLAAVLPDTRHAAGTLVDLARLVTAAALARRESRGSHYRSDYPQPDAAWERRQILDPAALRAAVA